MKATLAVIVVSLVIWGASFVNFANNVSGAANDSSDLKLRAQVKQLELDVAELKSDVATLKKVMLKGQ